MAYSEKLINEAYAEVIYFPAYEMIKVKWKGSVTNEQYRNAFETALKHSETGHPIKRFYTDTRLQGVIGRKNRKWFEQEMLPRAVKAGLQRAGTITDAGIFKRYYLNMISKSMNKFNLPFKLCGSEEEVVVFLLKEEMVKAEKKV